MSEIKQAAQRKKAESKKKFKVVNWVMYGFLIIFVLIAISNLTNQNQSSRDRVVRDEDIYCVSAICLVDGPISRCLSISPTVSHMIVTDDAEIKDAHRLIVKPTNRACGRTTVFAVQESEVQGRP
jgi:hypothetical protein